MFHSDQVTPPRLRLRSVPGRVTSKDLVDRTDLKDITGPERSSEGAHRTLSPDVELHASHTAVVDAEAFDLS